ncbi:MAG: homoserine kinase [Actinomycetaceae bacterium]|nr:homoserine kinase [Actinomycetaceae bacterium]
MQLMHEHVHVYVPATTANLGPGFDSLGMAFDYHDEVIVKATTGPTTVTIEGEGAGTTPTDESNLVVKAVRIGLEWVGAPQVGLDMTCINRIPHGRGMGSSASALAAGLGVARGLIAYPDALDDDTIFQIVAEHEGHPDNAAPAVYGGATIAWMDAQTKKAHYVPMEVRPEQRLTLLIPEFDLPTDKAREILPKQVPLADAVSNVSRAALLVYALAHDPKYLMDATVDRLHQEQRRNSMPSSLELMDALRERGYPAVISGAGPTVLVLGSIDPQLHSTLEERGWRVEEPNIDLQGLRVETNPGE